MGRSRHLAAMGTSFLEHGDEITGDDSMLVENTWGEIDMLIIPMLGEDQFTIGYLSVETVLATESIASRSLGDDGLRVLEVLFPKGHPFMWEPDRF